MIIFLCIIIFIFKLNANHRAYEFYMAHKKTLMFISIQYKRLIFIFALILHSDKF